MATRPTGAPWANQVAVAHGNARTPNQQPRSRVASKPCKKLTTTLETKCQLQTNHKLAVVLGGHMPIAHTRGATQHGWCGRCGEQPSEQMGIVVCGGHLPCARLPSKERTHTPNASPTWPTHGAPPQSAIAHPRLWPRSHGTHCLERGQSWLGGTQSQPKVAGCATRAPNMAPTTQGTRHHGATAPWLHLNLVATPPPRPASL